MSLLLTDIDATCASLGYHDKEKYYIENDTLQSLKHLIWILKRDNLESHECRRYMGHKKVLQTDLIPMLAHYCSHGGELSEVLLRLIVNLTSPAVLFFRHELPKDNAGRQIYLDLVEISYDHKEAFANSHNVWTSLAAHLKKLIDIDVGMRTDEQSVTIERILVLTRNVLQVPANPQHERRVDNDLGVHDQILCALHDSGMFELILYILCSHYESQYYLHALELIHLILREQNAEALASSTQRQRSEAEKHVDEQALIAARKHEKAKSMRNLPPARHSRFGGTYVYRNMKSVSDRDLICHQPLEKVAGSDLSRDKKKAKANFRLIKDEDRYERQSAFCVRQFLHEFCGEILSSAFNNLIVQARRLVERNHANDSAVGYDQSYLLWAIRFFLQFNRCKGFDMACVTKAMSKETIHWITLQIQHSAEMIQSDKKKKLVWNRRLQLGAMAYTEFLQSLQVMDSVESEEVKMLSTDLKYIVFTTSEYSEIILHLILGYNENSTTRMCLKVLIEAANIFLIMMEKLNLEEFVAPVRKERSEAKENKRRRSESPKIAAPQETQAEKLKAEWNDKILPKIIEILANDDVVMDKDILEIDLEEPEEEQRKNQIVNIVDLLNDEAYEKALMRLNACRDTWTCEEFGTGEDCLIDEITTLKEIFLSQNVSEAGCEDFWAEFDRSGEEDKESGKERDKDCDNDGDDDNEEEGEEEERETLQKLKSFADVEKRLVNQRVVRACVFVLQGWETSTYREIKSTVTILHRIAVNQKFPIMLMQAQLFRIFQQVFDAPPDHRYEELRRIGAFVVRQFSKMVIKNPKMYAELLFHKTARECNDIENNYEEHQRENEGKYKAWLEHEEEELRRLFLLNQESPQTDQDVIDWLVENLSERQRTRRGVISKLKELGLIFKAPTKKSNAAAVNRNLFIREEDDRLRELYSEHRLDDDCLASIMEVFHKKRTQKTVVKRMVQLGLIADESELMPIKAIKKHKKKVSELREFPPQSDGEEEGVEEREDAESENDYGEEKEEEEEEISVRKIKTSDDDDDDREEEEEEILSPTKDEHNKSDSEKETAAEEAETVSKKRQLLQSDSDDDEINTSAHTTQKRKVRRIIESDDDE